MLILKPCLVFKNYVSVVTIWERNEIKRNDYISYIKQANTTCV